MLYSFDGKKPEVGTNTYISETAVVVGDVVIGDGCYIGHGAVIRGDYGRIVIGNGTAVEEGVIIHAPPQGECKIGNKVTFGHGAIIHAQEICDFAVIGMGAVISLFSKINTWAIIGEGAVVKMKQEIPPNVVAVGNPAQAVRNITEKDQSTWLAAKQLYIDLAAKYLKIGMHPVGDKQASR